MQEANTPSVLRFDAVEIDLAGRRLLRDGQPQAIEPKAFAVLCLLADQPGKAFSRDEILDAIWGHRHITPGTLNRVITLLRHALGESADQPRYLHTLHGVGYRLDAHIDRVEVRAPAASIFSETASGGRPPLLEATPVANTTDAGVADATAQRRRPRDDAPTLGVGERLRAGPPRSTTSRYRGWALLAVGAALGLVVLLRWPAQPVPESSDGEPVQSAEPAAAQPVLAVLPLRPLGDDTRNAEFADGLSEELVNLLARIDGLRVISHTSSVQLRGAAAPLPELAGRLGASHVIEGSVRQQGEHLRIALRLVEADSDATLWSESFDRPFADIFAVQDSVARAVGEALRLRLTQPPSSFSVNEDALLYMRYLQARQQMPYHMSGTVEQLQAPRELLETLTREHPGYARAWGGLATVYWLGSANVGPRGQGMRDQAEVAATRALALDPEQPDALGVLADQACREQRWRACEELLRRAVARAPSDGLWRVWQSNRLATTGHISAALRELDTALTVDPLNSVHHYRRGRILDTLGRHDEAFRHLQLAEALPTGGTAHYFNAIWRNDLVTARALAERVDPDMPWRESRLALVQALQDPARLPEFLDAIDRGEAQMAERGLHVPYDFNRWFLPERDFARDIEALDRVQRAGYATYQWNFWMPRERALRQTPEFQRYLRDSGLLAYWRESGWPDVCRSDGGEGVVCD